MSQGHRRLRGVLWLCLMAAAFITTHLPASSLPHSASPPDIVLHFTGYAALGFATCYWLQQRRVLGVSSGLAGFLLLAVYGVFDETTQPLVGRCCEFGDYVADLVGSAFAILLVGLVRRGMASKRN